MLIEPVLREAGPRPGGGSRTRRWWTFVAALVVLGSVGAAVVGTLARGEPLARASGLRQVGEFFAAAARPELGLDFLDLTARAAAMALAWCSSSGAVRVSVQRTTRSSADTSRPA